MWGREEQVDLLAASIDRLANEGGGTIFLTGDRGSGKSVLVDRLAEYGETRTKGAKGQ